MKLIFIFYFYFQKIYSWSKFSADLEFSNSELKRKIDENNEAFNIYKIENQKVRDIFKGF